MTTRLSRFVLTVLICLAVTRAGAFGGDIEFKRPIAITNARIVTSPGQIIEKGMIVMANGRIAAVGAEVPIPTEAERYDGTGLTVYPGFIDALTNRGVSRAEPSGEEVIRQADITPDVREGVQSAMVEGYRRLVHPSWRVTELFDPAHARREDFRAAGFTAAMVAPRTVIFSGESALVSMGELPARKSIIRDSVAQHAAFVTSAEGGRGRFGGGGGYPGTTMGAIALFRQTLMDASWHRDLKAWSGRNASAERVAIDPELESLWRLQDGQTGLALVANTEVEIHRALDIAGEQKMKPIIVGGKEAWKAAERLKAEGVAVIVSLKWSDEPKKPKKRVESLASVKIDDAEEVARGIDRSPVFDKGWEEQAWEPKRVYEERVRLWQEEIDNAKKLSEAGVRYAFASYEMKSPDDVLKQIRKAMERGLSEDAAITALTKSPAQITGTDALCGEIAPGKLANLTLLSGPLSDKQSTLKSVFVEGEPFDIGVREERGWKKDGEGEKPDGENVGERGTAGGGEKSAEAVTTAPSEIKQVPTTSGPADPIKDATTTAPTTSSALTTSSAPSSQPDDSEIWSEFDSEIEADRKPRFETGGNLLIRNANLLTITGGDLKEADLLIQDGKIAAVGGKISPPAGVPAIDLRGYFITPGLIDPHSHMCTSGGLNEGTLSATPEVRVSDVVDSKDLSAFRALAGGVTMIHTMHGSANTVGGQCTVLRLKYGKAVKAWRVPEAPRTVKFALGENVKQSNSQTKATRFPNTRMGVEAVFRRSFDAAVAYKKELENFDRDKKSGKDPRPPRRDLRLDAFCEINAGRIWVHCHCYRADEILRLLDMAESYGFRIAVLQHVLEGYRVIPEIFRHGVSASTFSDWWAYKLESYDAVPHNAARMAQAGIVTTVNSDSGEVVRHMNLEAAKSMRFGGLSANDALRLCTLNGAITLGVEKQFGSIEVGKAADLAVFDGHPLDTFSKCVMTLIDGEAYFQHSSFEPTAAPTPLTGRTFAAHRGPMSVTLSDRGEYWIRGGTLHPVSGPAIESALMVISDGRIARVGIAGADAPGAGVTVVDATGLHVYPGLLCAGVSLGLIEIDSVAGSIDENDIARFQPDLHSLSAYNPFSSGIGVARSEGVTSALIISGGGVAQGQAGIVHLDGWSMPEARFVSPVGLFMQLPSMASQLPWWMDDETKDRMKKEQPKTLAAVEEFFRMAKQYARMKKLGAENADALPMFDRRLEAMVPYVNRDLPILFRADSYKAIREVIRFTEKYEVRPIIFGGREAWKVADLLAEKKIDVIVTRSMNLPSGEFEPWDSVYTNAAVLHRTGVRFCFTVGEPSLTKQLGVEAGMAVAHGLDEAAALRAVTLDAAAILGVGDKLGSLEAGKAADVIVTTDSPLQASNCVVAEFIRGVPVDLENKHTRDDAKFLARPKPRLPAPVDNLRGPSPMRMKPAA